MTKYLKMVFVIIVLASLTGRANAQALFPHTYELSCSGHSSSNNLSLVGDIQFNSTTAAVGGAEFVNGSIIQFASFTATFTNGTANAQGVGGNGIPKGCFGGTANFSGDTFGVLGHFFGCYSETTHGFTLTQTSSSLGANTALTCDAKEM
jgi:hypothetical protein